MNDPIDRIEWLAVDQLTANHYNPNVVFSPELRLLEHSILAQGWIQPILVTTEMTIIDGFHRWSLSRDSKALREKYGAKVPCVVMDLSEAEAMMLTVRINRAKGTHVAARMSDLVRALIDQHGQTPEEVAKGIGANSAEVDLLYQADVFERKDIKNAKYSRAWRPAEDTTEPRDEYEKLPERVIKEREKAATKGKPTRARNPGKKQTSGRRFNSEEYLKVWAESGVFPKIHANIGKMIKQYGTTGSAVDICGNTGLLATWLHEQGTPTIVVEMDTNAIESGRKFNVPVTHFEMCIEPTTYAALFALLREQEVQTFVARRCMSELFVSPEDPDAAIFCAGLIEAGIQKVFIQGRAPTKKATHPIPTVDHEIKLFLSHFKVVEKKGQVAYLVPRG